MPKLGHLIPMLSVIDLQRTMQFYCETLGFEIINTFGGQPPVWCMLRRHRVELMFNQPGGTIAADLPRRAKDYQVYYIYPDDVLALHREWQAAGVPVTDIRVTTYGMREFEIRDPDGYWLWFGESTTAQPTDCE